MAVDAFTGKPERTTSWYLDRNKELDSAADMPEYVRALVKRAMANFPLAPNEPA